MGLYQLEYFSKHQLFRHFPQFHNTSSEIRNAVLVIHGEKAHSVDFIKDIFPKLKGDNKELLLIPDAVHTDLYDRMDIIPFDKIETFFNTYLK